MPTDARSSAGGWGARERQVWAVCEGHLHRTVFLWPPTSHQHLKPPHSRKLKIIDLQSEPQPSGATQHGETCASPACVFLSVSPSQPAHIQYHGSLLYSYKAETPSRFTPEAAEIGGEVTSLMPDS